MMVGDYIRYRDRLDTDPEVSGDPNRDGWGSTGIVVDVTQAVFHDGIEESAIVFLDPTGDFHLARSADVEILSSAIDNEEAMWKMWGDR